MSFETDPSADYTDLEKQLSVRAGMSLHALGMSLLRQGASFETRITTDRQVDGYFFLSPDEGAHLGEDGSDVLHVAAYPYLSTEASMTYRARLLLGSELARIWKSEKEFWISDPEESAVILTVGGDRKGFLKNPWDPVALEDQLRLDLRPRIVDRSIRGIRH